ALNHPNIVRTYEYIFEANDEQTDGVFYSVMEYCAGDLFEYVNGIRGPLTKSLVESIFLQVVDAVHYLHNLPNRVAHRDLKMDNICVLEDGTVKLIDFGGSRTLPEDSNTIIGVCGSDPYLSPEVANDPNTPYNPLALDVWSLGIVYVAMCSGHFPWEV
ncbi:kinase-like protein, partial [Ramicandelaber brevisporus]